MTLREMVPTTSLEELEEQALAGSAGKRPFTPWGSSKKGQGRRPPRNHRIWECAQLLQSRLSAAS